MKLSLCSILLNIVLIGIAVACTSPPAKSPTRMVITVETVACHAFDCVHEYTAPGVETVSIDTAEGSP